MKNIYNIFTILILFISFGVFLASPLKSEAWLGYYYPPVNSGYNSPNHNYYDYRDYNDYNNGYYNNRYNNYNDIYYGGNDYRTPTYDMNYGYRYPGYNQGYTSYNTNNNYSTYNNYNGLGSYSPYTYSGWSRSYSYCTGFYCSQY